MCGIVGVIGEFGPEDGARLIDRMNSTIVHRGPDSQGGWATAQFAFAMRRLSIIDLDGGRQPMWTDTQTGIVFNGEIYNYRQLRQDLENKGYCFRTRSDTEVILALYETQGIRGIERLEGMFAFCLYDPRQKAVHLVRDRLGIKPLYFAPQAGRFYFASEAKAILAGLGSSPALNRQAIHDYLTLRYVPSPETIWEGIYKLEPGCRLIYDLQTGAWEKIRYWEVRFASQPVEPGRKYPKEFEELFLDSVEKHLVASDVPVGVLLSGGLDSSAVSAAAVELGHRNFHTFSVGFDEGGSFSELGYARELAGHIGSQHHEVVIGQREFIEFLPELVYYSDEPLADLASVPLFFVSRLAREQVKVVLTGEGSDEILAGYDMEVLARRLEQLRQLSRWAPKPLASLVGGLIPGRIGAALRSMARHGWSGTLKAQGTHITRYWNETEKELLWAEGDRSRPLAAFRPTVSLIRSWYDRAGSEHPLDQLQEVYCRSWLVEDLLMKADKMSMANSLELRVPFLDHRLVEWAAALPVIWKVGGPRTGYTSKKVLRDFARKRIPKSIIERPKQGFPVPAYQWLKGNLGAWAEQELFKNGRFARFLFELSAVRPVLDAARRGDAQAAHKVWLLIILEYWGRRWT